FDDAIQLIVVIVEKDDSRMLAKQIKQTFKSTSIEVYKFAQDSTKLSSIFDWFSCFYIPSSFHYFLIRLNIIVASKVIMMASSSSVKVHSDKNPIPKSHKPSDVQI